MQWGLTSAVMFTINDLCVCACTTSHLAHIVHTHTHTCCRLPENDCDCQCLTGRPDCCMWFVCMWCVCAGPAVRCIHQQSAASIGITLFLAVDLQSRCCSFWTHTHTHRADILDSHVLCECVWPGGCSPAAARLCCRHVINHHRHRMLSCSRKKLFFTWLYSSVCVCSYTAAAAPQHHNHSHSHSQSLQPVFTLSMTCDFYSILGRCRAFIVKDKDINFVLNISREEHPSTPPLCTSDVLAQVVNDTLSSAASTHNYMLHFPHCGWKCTDLLPHICLHPLLAHLHHKDDEPVLSSSHQFCLWLAEQIRMMIGRDNIKIFLLWDMVFVLI